MTHTGIKPFQCPHCDKAFSLKTSLNTHIRLHTGEKPYKCSACGRDFSDASSCRRHVKSHEGKKPHVCTKPGCRRKFIAADSLQAHMFEHEEEEAVMQRRITRKQSKQMKEEKKEVAPILPVPVLFIVENQEVKSAFVAPVVAQTTPMDIQMSAPQDIKENAAVRDEMNSYSDNRSFAFKAEHFSPWAPEAVDYLADDTVDSYSPASSTPFRDSFSPDRMFSPTSDSGSSDGDLTPVNIMNTVDAAPNDNSSRWGHGSSLSLEVDFGF